MGLPQPPLSVSSIAPHLTYHTQLLRSATSPARRTAICRSVRPILQSQTLGPGSGSRSRLACLQGMNLTHTPLDPCPTPPQATPPALDVGHDSELAELLSPQPTAPHVHPHHPPPLRCRQRRRTRPICRSLRHCEACVPPRPPPACVCPRPPTPTLRRHACASRVQQLLLSLLALTPIISGSPLAGSLRIRPSRLVCVSLFLLWVQLPPC